MKKRRRLTFFLILIGFLIVSWLFSPTIMWDGGFPRVEYRVTPIDRDGKVIKGMEMRVVDSHADPANKYPVFQYSEKMPLRQNEKGEFVFHQIRSGIQFGGKYTSFLGLLPIGSSHAPKIPPDFFAERFGCLYA